MFDAAEHMRRAEIFLGTRMRLMVIVRPRVLIACTRTDMLVLNGNTLFWLAAGGPQVPPEYRL